MAATKYLEIYNAHGNLIIDDTYKNLRLVSITKPSIEDEPGRLIRLDVPLNPGEFAGVFCSSDDYYIHASHRRNLLHVRLHRADERDIGIGEFGFIENAITIYKFSDTQDTNTERIGLLVWNKDGELVFNSNSRYARVVGQFLKTEVNPTQVQTLPDGMPQTTFGAAKVAAIPFTMHEWQMSNPQVVTFSSMKLRWHSHNSLKVIWTPDHGYAHGTGYIFDRTGVTSATCILFIDVTNY